MKIPKKIKVAGLVYQVKFLDHIPDSRAQAQTHHDKQIIYIRKMKQERMEQTFFHEIMHCINGELEEFEAEAIAIGIFQVLKDNKLLK
ncbi:MAG TPA: hypothetical protein VEL70_01795 [Candidatus Acidoferrum sp.]|nr:hypothetical protein [Candidatus Acidoferrum sp.]